MSAVEPLLRRVGESMAPTPMQDVVGSIGLGAFRVTSGVILDKSLDLSEP